ncbi:FxSxx-COOH system tetratricopeptide repeat protein [Actinacidiphila glaucinigra]|uniref:FxSxx-COOH system tetratricopeptide repeat protein n=1 Tax=Actinacidiphila glaucinigra TaxID=235986 RepID=UPI0037CB97F4
MTGTGDIPLLTAPLVAWPRHVLPGSRHLVTVDLAGPLTEDGGNGDWAWHEEELEFVVGLDGGDHFTCQALEEPLLVLHRFGGTYGLVEFLVETADGTSGPAALWLSLTNAHGVPVHVVELPVDIAPAGPDTPPAPPTRHLPAHTSTSPFTGTAEEPAAPPPLTILYAGPDSAWALWAGDVCRRHGRPVRYQRVAATRIETPRQIVVPALEAALGPVLFLLGHSLLRRPVRPADEWTAPLAEATETSAVRLTVMAVDDTALPALPPREVMPAALEGMDAPHAEEHLTRRLGLGPELPGTAPAVRHPGLRPRVTHGVPSRNRRFTGREDLLARIYRRLHDAGTPARLALAGIPGVGKTQLATEYAHRFASQYDLVCWVSGENRAVYRRDLAALGRALNPPAAADHDYRQGVRAALDALRAPEHRPWLLIVDNADDPGEIHDLVPGDDTTSHGHVLITSRTAQWESRQLPVLDVPVYQRDEAVETVRRRVPQLTDSEAQTLAEALGDMPLALSMAAAWLANSGGTVSQYVERLAIALDVPAAWAVTLQELESTDTDALALLRLCAHFAPGPVPLGMFLGTPGPDRAPPPLQRLLGHPDTVQRAVDVLLRYALVTRAHDATGTFGPFLGIHSVVHAQVRAHTPPGARDEYARAARAVLRANDPGTPDNSGTWPDYGELVRHLPHCDALTTADSTTLVLHCLRQMYLVGEYDAALQAAETVRDAWRGQAPGDVLRALDHEYGNLLRAVGDHARSATVSAALVEHETSGAGLIRALSGHAADLRATGRYQEALESSRQASAYSRTRLTSHRDPLVATSLNNLAVSLRLLGNYHEALALDDQAANQRAESLGAGHHWTLWSEFMVALDLRLLGRINEALSIQQGNLRASEERLGTHRVQTLLARHNWVQCLRAVGRTEEAGQEIGRAMRDAARLLADHDLRRLQVTTAHGMYLHDQGDRRRALDTMTAVHHGYLDRLGEEHPFTAGSKVNLAIVTTPYDSTAAQALAADGLTVLAGLLTDSHPWTAGSRRTHRALARGEQPGWEFEPLTT